MQVSDSSCRILAGLLETRTGQQLTISRRWRIETSLAPILRERGIGSIDELITLLVMGKEPSLAGQVVEALLNNETYFFRDRAPFDLLARQALPELARSRGGRKQLRIWSAGCSTGQEAYSIAMQFAEDPATWRGWQIEIVGTDVSETVVNRAREGRYSQFEVQRGLGITQMIRWFGEVDGGWQANAELRRMVKFKTHNLLDPAPMQGPFDVILCRNVLLYLNAERRRLVFDRLASMMAPDGWLMLGAGETVIGQTGRFEADPTARGLYHPVQEQRPQRIAAGA